MTSISVPDTRAQSQTLRSVLIMLINSPSNVGVMANKDANIAISSVLRIASREARAEKLQHLTYNRAEKWKVVFIKAVNQGKANLTDGKGSCYTGPAFPAPFIDLHALGIHTE